MFFEFGFAKIGSAVAGVGFTVNELLLNQNIRLFFQRFQVACQIAIGDVKQLFEAIEIGGMVYHEYGHNAQSYSVVE